MKLGAHQSVAGGLERAIEAAVADGCEAVQIFSRNQNRWQPKPLSDDAVARFRAAVAAWGVPPQRLLAHDSYLINLAAVDREIRTKSRRALGDELRRCARLGIGYLVMHPGAHMGRGEARAIRMIAAAVSRTLAEVADRREPPSILLENTAGQGTNVGWRFEHLRDLLAAIEPADRVGVCIDTQHTFAAGYDLATASGYDETFAELDRVVGLEHVRAFHLNDSKRELGARVDRHERLGHGHIGGGCFRRLVNDRRFAALPAVLELPPPYPPQLARLRRWSDGTATARRRPSRRRL